MESISRFACVSSFPVFLPSVVKPRSSVPSRVSIGRLRSHNYNMINPKKRERRSKQWWRWEDFSGLDPITEEDEDQNPPRVEDPTSDEELGQELEVLEKEAIEGPDEGREPSDYDRRAQIFDESSRVFKVLKEKSENAGTGSSS
ncbi:hypothetical protein FCM35_KLT03256 [Carex littledalei]|uniref:Uncharacterized protein n=1 Tax=Carex littledalei TaxID=544730 RepID=A0A833QR76_9POAL|nr:hypothetical protein FCM35_KLT03256 [Carex littledalei]